MAIVKLGEKMPEPAERACKRLERAARGVAELAGDKLSGQLVIEAIECAIADLRELRRAPEPAVREVGYLGEATRRLAEAVRDTNGSTVTITKADACAIGGAIAMYATPDSTAATTNSEEIGRKSVDAFPHQPGRDWAKSAPDSTAAEDEIEKMARLLEGMDYDDTRKAATLLRRLSRREGVE